MAADLAVVTALPEESAVLRSALNTVEAPCAAPPGGRVRRWVGRSDSGVTLEVVATGAGKADATEGMALLLRDGSPGLIVAAGIAGAVTPEVRPGDIVVPSETFCYDRDATAVGLPLGTLMRPRVAPAGSTAPPGAAGPAAPGPDHAALTRILPARAETVGEAVFPRAPRVHHGGIACGDTFLTAEKLAELPEVWREAIATALAVDMESAVWAEWGRRGTVPMFLFRYVSDNVLDGERLPFRIACRGVGELLLGVVAACRKGPDGAIVIR
jgi:adenosylhomocysteine nucleosidase